MYSFRFRNATHCMVLDTGAKRNVFSSCFARNHKLRLVTSEIKNIQIDDSRRLPVKYAAALLQIKLGTISSTVVGPLMKDLSHNVVAVIN